MKARGKDVEHGSSQKASWLSVNGEKSQRSESESFYKRNGKKGDKKERVIRMKTGVKGYELMNGVKCESQ